MLTEATRRRDFPTLTEMTYLNTAAEGIPSLAVGDALALYFQHRQRGMDGRIDHYAQWEAARAATARMFGLSTEEVGICSSSSEAFNLLAMAARLQPGDEVIINDLDYPAGYTPWMQPSCPATIKRWKAREGALRVEDLIPLLGPRTRLVTTSLVSYYNGFTLSLPPVVEAVRKHSSALLAVDVTQGLGRIPLDLRGVDAIISSTHKWILASHGGGLVGIPKERAAELTVPAGGWFNLQNAFDADRFDRVVTKAGALSFMVGMPNFAALYAIRAALEYLEGVGVAQIAESARPLVRQCLDGLKPLPIEIITPDEDDALAGILSFRHTAFEEIARRLHDENVHVMCHSGRIRISIHGYNTADNVEKLLRNLRDILRDVGSH